MARNPDPGGIIRSNLMMQGVDAYCGVIPDDINDSGETFPGGTITGNVCWSI